MRRPGLLALALALPAALAAAGQYYPATVGQRWLYSNGETQQYTATRVVNGAAVLVLAHSSGGRLTVEDYLQAGPAGVRLLGSRAGGSGPITWYAPPLTVYPAGPLDAAARWSSSSRVSVGGKDAGSVAISSRVVGTEGVVTAAGRFNALVVRSTVTTSSGGSSVSDSYFVPTVGTVRFVTQDGSTVDLTGR